MNLCDSSQKDMEETKIHHMLSENLFMPRNQPRKLSYSRHAIDDNDVPSNNKTGVDFKVHMQVDLLWHFFNTLAHNGFE